MKKVLIIGKRGFIGKNLNKFLKTKYNVKLISFKEALKIYNDSIIELKNQLLKQILDDGGHYERTAAYHFLILEDVCYL